MWISDLFNDIYIYNLHMNIFIYKSVDKDLFSYYYFILAYTTISRGRLLIISTCSLLENPLTMPILYYTLYTIYIIYGAKDYKGVTQCAAYWDYITPVCSNDAGVGN